MNKKILKVTLTIMGQDESFVGYSGKNQMSSTGFRATANIVYGNGSVMPNAQIKLYGLRMETINQLLRVHWNTMQALMNTIKIEAGEEGGTLSKVYEGNITFAYPDMAGAPDIALTIESQAAVIENLKPAEPMSIKEPTDGAYLIETICKRMDYSFENNGASKISAEATYENSDLHKIREICTHCDFDLYIEQKLIAIAPKGGNRDIAIPVITPDTGLIGYPTPDLRGVKFKCFYDPLLRFGGIVNLSGSAISTCNADWRIYGLTTTLDSNVPNGNWFCEVNATWRNSPDAAVAR